MTHRSRWWWLGAWSLAGVLGMLPATLPARGADEVNVARWIDAEQALVYAEIVRPEALIDAATSERVRRLFRAVPGIDEALDRKDFRELRQVVQYLSQRLQKEPVEGLRGLVGGGLVLAVEGGTKPERAYLIVTPRDSDFLARVLAELHELARRDARSKGRPDPVAEAQYRGLQGYSLAAKEAHAIVEGRLVVASGSEALKALVDRIQDQGGAANPLAENPTWKARRVAAGEETVAWAIANLERLRAIDPKSFAPERVDPGAVFLFGPWLEAARKADWISAHLGGAGARLTAEIALPRPESGYPGSLAGYLPGTEQGAAPPLKVPGVIASGSLWRDLSAIWSARGELFPAEAQPGFAKLDTFAGQFFGGRDFGSGVLGALGTNWRVIIARQEAKDLDPTPAVLLPAVAVVVDLNPDDPDFALRLQAAFQSFIGVANLDAAQKKKGPPLLLGSEEFKGHTITTARYLPAQDLTEGEPVHARQNFQPSTVQVGDHFVLSTSLALARDLVRVLSEGSTEESTDATLLVEADGAALAALIEQNREQLILQNMAKEGNDRAAAEAAVDLFGRLVATIGHASFRAVDSPEGPRLRLVVEPGK